jgi:hypothetical protein
MKLKKVAVAVIAIALLVGGGEINPTYAAKLQEQTLTKANQQVITPLWSSISIVSPDISVSGKILYPEVYVEAKSSSGSISGKMYLERYDMGRWVGVTSWNFQGTNKVFLSKSSTGMSGVKYRTKVSVTVDGESTTAISRSCEVK